MEEVVSFKMGSNYSYYDDFQGVDPRFRQEFTIKQANYVLLTAAVFESCIDETNLVIVWSISKHLMLIEKAVTISRLALLQNHAPSLLWTK
jgi:hypothetical protein